MDLDLTLVRFDGIDRAAEAFAAARDQSGGHAPWTHEVGLVEHHHNGHLVLRGTFAGHYLDADEALHVSQRGTAEGFLGGAAIGILLGPPGLAAGAIVGGVIGSQVGTPGETDAEPQPLADQLRAAVPRSGSAILLIAAARDVDDMLTALGERDEAVTRQTLTAEQVAALEASLSAAPAASPGPSTAGTSG